MTQKDFFHSLLKLRYFRGDVFTLDAVTRKTISSMQSRYPDNQHIEAKIRQLLQELRDDGELEFLGGGVYRLQGPVKFTSGLSAPERKNLEASLFPGMPGESGPEQNRIRTRTDSSGRP